MSHWRQYMDSKYVGAWDFMNEEGVPREGVVTIDKVEKGEVVSQSGKARKPVIWFKGKEKPFVCNVTNAKTIARMYGNDPREWEGKSITLYVGEANNQGETVPALRVRPTPPRAAVGKPNGKDQPPVAREPGAEG